MSKRKANLFISNAALFTSALVWGLAFVFQKDSVQYIGPFSFSFLRCILGSLVLVPFAAVSLRVYAREHTREELTHRLKKTLVSGLFCGVSVAVATIIQQVGIEYTTAGKSGFITAMYIVMVPMFQCLRLKKLPGKKIVLSILIAVCGLYLLSIKGSFSVNKGDLMVMVSALFFAIQIVIIDIYGKDSDAIAMNCLEFFVSALAALPLMLIFEPHLTFEVISAAKISILYTGILSTGLAYTTQIVGQKHSENPTVAALIMSGESVFAVLFGWIILKESLDTRELIGVLLMLAGIIMAQLPDFMHKKEKAEIK